MIKCPECNKPVSEDQKYCPVCEVQLWSPKTLKSWDIMENIKIVND